jgi:hypothetical protein
MENSEVTPRLAILDLDPLDSIGTTILADLYKAYPHLRVLGMTVFPHAAFPVGPLQAIIDKTEILIQLQWQLNQQLRVDPG